MDRDRTKQLTEHTKKENVKKQEMNLFKNLKKEVEIGALQWYTKVCNQTRCE